MCENGPSANGFGKHAADPEGDSGKGEGEIETTGVWGSLAEHSSSRPVSAHFVFPTQRATRARPAQAEGDIEKKKEKKRKNTGTDETFSEGVLPGNAPEC